MICKVCGKDHPEVIRRNLDIVINREELKEITSIRNKGNCVEQALNLSNVPENVSQDLMDKFVKSILKEKQETMEAESSWWNSMIKKYSLIGNVYLDFSDGSLYYNEEHK